MQHQGEAVNLLPPRQASVRHIRVAQPILTLITLLTGLLGATLLIGGIYIAAHGQIADTTFTLLGNEFSSKSVGVALAFVGSILVISLLRRVLRALETLAALPKDKEIAP
jgi:uncharacterized membrane protein YgaE (UPF0421/DUF939 family)